MKDPKITMDTVRYALRLMPAVPASAGQINESICNSPALDGQDRDGKAEKLLAKANVKLRPYGAWMRRYGEGCGLHPYVSHASGSIYL